MNKTFQQYQTSFSLAADDAHPVDVLFAEAKETMKWWISGKENARANKFGNKAYGFAPGSDFAQTTEAKSWVSSCRTLAARTQGADAWAAEYIHKDDETEGLAWVNDIALRVSPDASRVVFSLRISRSMTPELFRQGGFRIPDSATPKCVRQLFRAIPGLRILSGKADFTPAPDSLRRIVSSPEDATAAAALLRDGTRALPVILYADAAPLAAGAPVAAEELAHAVLGKALVLQVPFSRTPMPLLRDFLVRPGEFRLVLPFSRFGSNLRRHPVFSARTPAEKAESTARLLRSLFCHFSACEEGAIESLDALAATVRHAEAARLRNELFSKERAAVSTEQWETLARELVAENAELVKRNEGLADETSTLRDRVFSLETLAHASRPVPAQPAAAPKVPVKNNGQKGPAQPDPKKALPGVMDALRGGKPHKRH